MFNTFTKNDGLKAGFSSQFIKEYTNLFRKKNSYISYEELKERCKRLEIYTYTAYNKRYKEIPGAPSNPGVAYKDKWKSFREFFEYRYWNELKARFITLEQLIKKCRKRKIRSSVQYERTYKGIKGAPSNPLWYYRHFNGKKLTWSELFGKHYHVHINSFLSLRELKRECKKRKIKAATEYQSVYKGIKGAPSNPMDYYRPKGYPNISWDDILDR